MEYTVELAKFDLQHSLVLWVSKTGIKQFVVCSYYDPEKPVGQQWSWGHYFWDLLDAVDYAKENGYVHRQDIAESHQ